MLIPFGEHKGKELSTIHDGYLWWIANKMDLEPPLNVNPENREQWAADRRLLQAEAARELRERRRNGVKVENPNPKPKAKKLREWRW